MYYVLRAGVSDATHQKIRLTKKAMFEKETSEQKTDRVNRHKEGAKKIDWHKVNQKIADNRRDWSDEQKAKYSQQMSNAAKRRWDKKKEHETCA